MNEENKENQALITRDPNTHVVLGKNRVADFLLGRFIHNPNKWSSVEELAREFQGRATEDNRRKTRHAITAAGRCLLPRGFFLLKVFAKGDYGEIRTVKIFDPANESDRGYAECLVKKMAQRGELSEQQLKAIENIMGEDSSG